MKTKQLTFVFSLLALLLVSVSCDRNRVFDSYVTVPKKGWDKDSLACFKVPVHSTQQAMNLLVNIRNTQQYPNSNLWLFIDVKSPSGKTERDTIECMLADVNGEWTGKGWGSIFHSSILWKRGVKFAEHGDYEFKVSHGMRSSELQGIQDVGLRVETVN
ncbi:MAG: gliding motility lipoprotein GldH [Breznakibacter sp.]